MNMIIRFTELHVVCVDGNRSYVGAEASFTDQCRIRGIECGGVCGGWRLVTFLTLS